MYSFEMACIIRTFISTLASIPPTDCVCLRAQLSKNHRLLHARLLVSLGVLLSHNLCRYLTYLFPVNSYTSNHSQKFPSHLSFSQFNFIYLEIIWKNGFRWVDNAVYLIFGTELYPSFWITCDGRDTLNTWGPTLVKMVSSVLLLITSPTTTLSCKILLNVAKK